MDSFFQRFKNPLVLIAIVLLQTIGLAVQVQPAQESVQAPATIGTKSANADGHKTNLLRYWAVAIVTPFERLARGGSRDLRSLWSGYVDLRHTHRDNLALQTEVARLRQEQAAFAEDAAQGRRLQAMLTFREQYIASTVPAQIIGTSGSDRSRIVYLDKGSADGLKPDQPVITPDGIVGKLRDVFTHTAQLLLINDPTSGAGVLFETSRIRGIIRGTGGGKVQVNNLLPDSRIKPGENVITSGGDMVFPRGLKVGVVESIIADPDHQPYTAITLKTTADLARLEEVLVITATSPAPTAAALKDASLAEATAAANAAANQRAADELAARLPGATDPADSAALAAPAAGPPAARPAPGAKLPSDTTIGGMPNVPNSGIPRVRPPLHDDRYTPGSTPPAGQLTPGAPHTSNQPPPRP